jgi:hypothetical protein
MRVLVWILINTVVSFAWVMLVGRRRSSYGQGTSSANDARRAQSAVEAQAHLNNIRDQSGPM